MNAVSVENIYKKFGKPSESLWQRMITKWRKSSTSPAAPEESAQGLTLSPTNRPSTPSGNGSSNPNGKANGKVVVAVDHVSFIVKPREIFGVLGPNGGGKSTLIRLISTLLLPDAGNIKIFDIDVVRHPMEVQRMINRVSVEASFFKKLSPYENLIYGARLYGLEGGQTRKKIVEILTRLGLEKRAIYNPMEEMSRGMQQKVAIARALLTQPRVLLLDEPTTGLDPRSKREVQAVVCELREKYDTTIILTTHDMNEADNLCDRIAIMDRGKMVAMDTPKALKASIPEENGKSVTLEDVFLKLTGKQLIAEDEPST